MNRIAMFVVFLMVAVVINGCAFFKKEATVPPVGANWSYSGLTSPEHWHQLDAKNKLCDKGFQQSPIDIMERDVEETKKLKKMEINYHPSFFSLENNGHTIEANPVTSGNKILIDGTSYALQQFHFHIPSEHQFKGKAFDMEMHLVHKNQAGNLAVIAVFMTVSENDNEPFLELFQHLPIEETKKDVPMKYAIDLNSVLPLKKFAYRYPGSLTTPPCSEGVTWIIMKQPIFLSGEQLVEFRNIIHHNARPIQLRYWRRIFAEPGTKDMTVETPPTADGQSIDSSPSAAE